VFEAQKIDGKPIFTVPESRQILALISGTVKMSAGLIFFLPNTNRWYCALS